MMQQKKTWETAKWKVADIKDRELHDLVYIMEAENSSTVSQE